MDDFHVFARIPMAIIDLKGRVLVKVGWQDICTQFHRVNPETCKFCIEEPSMSFSRCVPPGEFKVYKCKNNMWDVATPILMGGKHVGNLFTGQFFFQGELPESPNCSGHRRANTASMKPSTSRRSTAFPN